LYPIAKEGHRGVPVFFAISGYCIFAAAQRCIQQQSSSTEFLRRRLVRVFPTFWASIVIVLVLPYLLEILASLKAGSIHWPVPRWMDYSALDWLAVLSLTKELLDSARGGGPGYTLVNSVYWTLAIEVQFYLVLYFAISLRRQWLTFVAVMSVASFVALEFSLLNWPGFFLHYWPAFLCGVLLRIAYSTGLDPRSMFRKRELEGSLATIALVALLSWLVLLRYEMPFLGTAFISALVLWALGGIENGCKAKLGSAAILGRLGSKMLAPFILLGQCSYSLYLLHGKLYQLPTMFVRQVFPVSHPLHLIAVVGGTTLLCYGFYYVVERRYQGSQGPLRAARPALSGMPRTSPTPKRPDRSARTMAALPLAAAFLTRHRPAHIGRHGAVAVDAELDHAAQRAQRDRFGQHAAAFRVIVGDLGFVVEQQDHRSMRREAGDLADEGAAVVGVEEGIGQDHVATHRLGRIQRGARRVRGSHDVAERLQQALDFPACHRVMF
jgi:peptidoglycan/LPS O-acetylase OafA/YrhL